MLAVYMWRIGDSPHNVHTTSNNYLCNNTYHISRYLELAQCETSVPHHSVIAKMAIHAVQERRDDAPLQCNANTSFLLALHYVEKCSTEDKRHY